MAFGRRTPAGVDNRAARSVTVQFPAIAVLDHVQGPAKQIVSLKQASRF
jgi:hypothetical protein